MLDVLRVTFPFFALVLCGYWAARRQMLPFEAIPGLNGFVLFFALPCMLFQFGALFTDLTVFENVAYPLREQTELPESMIRDLVLMKLNAVGLRGAASLRISQVSGGMARRIALARAMALDPELIMYDEPFAGLDPISMGVAANLIRKLNDTTGATSLIVSHDVLECFLICDYAYLLSSQGRVVAHGRPDELRASTHPEVRQFIGGEPDGPVRFHYPARPLAEDLGVS